MDLEVRHLRLVSEVAALGSVTRAAERLHLTQSAISHQLRDIESRLGTRLFHRMGKRMVATPAGERVLRSAAAVLDNLRRTEEDVRQIAREGSGILRLCTQCNTGYYWLPPLLKTFNASYPKVEVQIAVEATTRPVESLLEGKLDLAVVTGEVEDRRVALRPLFRDELALVVSPEHRLASRRHIAPSELASEHLLIYSSSRHDSFAFRRVLDPAGVEPARVSHLMLTEAILEMVKANLGVTIIATWSVLPAIASGAVRAISLGPRGVFRQWSAATVKGAAEPRHVTDFIQLLAAQSLPARVVRNRIA
ncbi:MAG: LysR family transcriptional regulator [Vicinamibacterales bacterium]